jgi:choline dehydrogenase
VIAARLSEDAERQVLLLEAGPDFPNEAEALPLFAVSGEHTFRVFGAPEFDWGIADHDRAGRRGGTVLPLPRGRIVGGSSMLNSTVAVRPAPFDMDRWAGLSSSEWSWDSLLPHFIRMERDLDLGHEPIHGNEGPLVIQRYKKASWSAVNPVFAEAVSELGIPQTPDLNGLHGHCGVWGVMPHNRYKEVRQGTLVTYLRHARPRPNLIIRGSCLVDNVVVQRNRARAVRFIGPSGPEEASADLIVIAAGVYNSPAILQRSGVGPAQLLRSIGIPVAADLPTGGNLSDHVAISFQFKVDGIAGMTGRLIAANWRGPAGPDGEPWWQTHSYPIDEEEGICGLWTYLCRQFSTGTVTITGADPRTPPLVDHNYADDPRDRERFANAFEANKALLASKPFARHGAALVEGDAGLDLYLRRYLGTAHHQHGTCRMGHDQATSVVDPRLRVHGVDGLMVADSSIFPDTVMHNTNLTCFAVGEVASDMIRAH